MRYLFLSCGVLLALLGSLTSALPAAEDLIAKGDVCDVQFQAGDALKNYLAAQRLEPQDPALCVKIARQYRHLMSDASGSENKLTLGRRAIDYARKGVALAPDDPDTQLAMAISYGKVQPLMGNRERYEASGIIRTAAERTVQLDPSSDLGWHILGRWHEGIAEVTALQRTMARIAFGTMPVSTYQAAASCFEKAIQLNPDRLMHYIELGRVYAKMGKKAEAASLIKKGLAMRETEKDDPETKRVGRETLAQLR